MMPHTRLLSQFTASTTTGECPTAVAALRCCRARAGARSSQGAAFLQPGSSLTRSLRQSYQRPGRGRCAVRAAAAGMQDKASYLLANAFVDYYELLQVDDDATPEQIKSSYRQLAKVCHPDLLGDEGHNVCILLNEAYGVLMDPDKRRKYNAQLEQALKDEEDDYTGEALSKWMANSRMGKNKNEAEDRAVFVDEATCIGCKQCVWCAPATFRLENEYGRSRVFAQWLDNEDDIQAAVDSCPVSCIHWVKKDQLPALEYAIRNLVPRENVGIMMAGQGKPIADVFDVAVRFVKQREDKLRRAEATKRYSEAQEKARRAAAQKIAEQQPPWWAKPVANMFGFNSLEDAMRSNMGYSSGDESGAVGRRKRSRGPIRYNENTGGTIPPERALVPVSVTARGNVRDLMDEPTV